MSLQRSHKRYARPHLACVPGSARKREMRAVLRQRDGDDCFYCLLPLGADATLEHLVRWADGGTYAYDNLVLAHEGCNYATKHLTVDEKMLRRGDALLARIERERAAA